MPDKNQDEKINSSTVFRQHNLPVDLDKVDLDDLACRYLNKVNSHHGLTEGVFSWLFEITLQMITTSWECTYLIATEKFLQLNQMSTLNSISQIMIIKRK